MKTDPLSAFRCVLAVFAIGVLAAASVFAEHVPDEILVKFRPGASRAEIAAVNRAHGTASLGVVGRSKVRRMRIPKGRTVAEMVDAYSVDPSVVYAEPNRIRRAQWTPNDYAWSAQWHMRAINMEAAWDIQRGGSPGVIVAVIDTGVAYMDLVEKVQVGGRGRPRSIQTAWQAPDLAQTNFVHGWDFVNNDPYATDDEGHGTHVTGTIAQSTNNGIGVAGIAFNTTIMPIKVLGANGSGSDAGVAAGIRFAADNGAKIINMSLGGQGASQTLGEAVAYAYGKGVTIICSTGNAGSTAEDWYPAAFPECIAVTATHSGNAVTDYSNTGNYVDIAAPGDGVLQETFGSSLSDFGLWFYSGTSMAAPHVSGVAALLIASGVHGPAAVRDALLNNATDIEAGGWDTKSGAGLLNARAALLYGVTPVVDVAVTGLSVAETAVAGSVVPVTVEVTNFSTTEVVTTDVVLEVAGIGEVGRIVGVELTAGESASLDEVSWDTLDAATGTYEVIARITEGGGDSTNDSMSADVTLVDETVPVPMFATMVVELDGKAVSTWANATVKVVDVDGTPVPGATVFVTWDVNGKLSPAEGITGADGTVVIQSPTVKKAGVGTTFAATVTGVVATGYVFDGPPATDSKTVGQ